MLCPYTESRVPVGASGVLALQASGQSSTDINILSLEHYSEPQSLLVSLLGQSFTDTEGTVEPKTPYARAEEEMQRYCKAPSFPLTEDPLNWWRVQEITFPLLSRLSKRYLCIPGTSVSAERVFSTAGDVVTAKRSALKPEHVDQLVFLQKNLQIPKC